MLTKLVNRFIAAINPNPKFADNRLAKLSDLNAFADALGRSSAFGVDTYSVLVTQPGGVTTPTLKEIGCSCISGSGNCPTCLVTPCGYKCKSAITSFTQTDTGTYSLVINSTDYKPFNQVVVGVGNLTVAGFVTVEETDTTNHTFTIKTYNSAGVLTSFLFNNTLMKISFYGPGTTNYLI